MANSELIYQAHTPSYLYQCIRHKGCAVMYTINNSK